MKKERKLSHSNKNNGAIVKKYGEIIIRWQINL